MYIRTKDDNIYDLGSKGVSSWEYIDNDTAINKYGVEGAFYTIYYFDENKGHYSEYDNKGGRSCDFIDEKDILNQSENLAELCDLFIDEETKTIFHKHNGYVINWKTNMVYSLKALAKSFHSVKCAIYTGKGLIYVAKMNQEGELELI